MILITLAVSLKSLQPQCTPDGGCAAATRQQVAFFYGALYTMAIGAGGTKPNISTFGADQFDDFDAREREVKASFFNWWMFSSFTGGLVAVLVLVFVQENVGWGVGYTIPTVGLALSLLFYVGTPFYRHEPVQRDTAASPARLVGRVFSEAFVNRRHRLPSDAAELQEHETAWYTAAGKRRLHHTRAFRVLDRAALRSDTRRLLPCTVTEVEEVKLIIGMIVVWLSTLVPCTIWAQVNTLFVKQGTTLDRSMGGVRIPAASLGSFITISMLLSIPVYDCVLVPLVRRRTGNPRGITLLQRLGIGCAFQVLVVACAYLVEVRRMRVIRERSVHHAGDTVPMSIFWMLPQYVLLGVGDVFNSVGILEFFYYQSPDGMRSLGTTFFTSGLGVGNFLNSLLVTLVDRVTRGRESAGKSWIGDNLNDSHLDYYHVFLLLLSVLNMALFVWVAMRYKYKREFLEVEHPEFKRGTKQHSEQLPESW
ncbi:protein NRT1/ PTR FAMILY 5.1-like [Miscanthus floridulus]|uniref:protein NRT1/ PTR FAMILY 5.1-like n=1 Tax=Miscanthus floridulus TaxID=154761 RepID=UPI003458CDC7